MGAGRAGLPPSAGSQQGPGHAFCCCISAASGSVCLRGVRLRGWVLSLTAGGPGWGAVLRASPLHSCPPQPGVTSARSPREASAQAESWLLAEGWGAQDLLGAVSLCVVEPTVQAPSGLSLTWKMLLRWVGGTPSRSRWGLSRPRRVCCIDRVASSPPAPSGNGAGHGPAQARGQRSAPVGQDPAGGRGALQGLGSRLWGLFSEPGPQEGVVPALRNLKSSGQEMRRGGWSPPTERR